MSLAQFNDLFPKVRRLFNKLYYSKDKNDLFEKLIVFSNLHHHLNTDTIFILFYGQFLYYDSMQNIQLTHYIKLHELQNSQDFNYSFKEASTRQSYLHYHILNNDYTMNKGLFFI